MQKRVVFIYLCSVLLLLLLSSTSFAFQPILHEKLYNNKSSFNEGLKDAVGLAGMSAAKKVTLGGAVDENPTLQLRVRSSEPHYWRGMAYDSYTGDGFEITDIQKTAYFPKEQLPLESKNRIEKLLPQQYIIVSPQPSILLAAYEPFAVEDYSSAIEMDSYQALYISKELESNETYSITSSIADFNPDELRRSSTDYPSHIKDKYLQLPDIPKRVQDLANEVTANSNNPFDKANDINSYLKSSGNYYYNLKIKSPPADRDVVDYFLFESKEGYCVYFASAMVVMARSVGIPARLVTGYATGGWNPITETFDVIGTDAHAWVEVYFEGYGWVEFDPTTGRCSPNGYCPSRPRLNLPSYSQNLQDGKGNISSIQKIPTVTSINSYPQVAYRENQFKIEGYVSTLNGSGAENMEVKIFANKSKSSPGFLIGTSKTDSKGIFIANVTIPLEFELTTYDIIAKASENHKYLGSDSDPRIIVKSKTALTLDLKYEENILKTEGFLTDDAGKPIGDQSVKIFINDTLKDTAITDRSGKYSVERSMAPGEYDVKVAFSETDRYGASSVTQHIDTLKKNVDITISAKPESLDRNTTLDIIVRITSQNIPLDKTVLMINDIQTKIGEYAADEKGTVSIEYKFPSNAALGLHAITSEFNGDATHNKASATANVFLYSNTFITLFSDKQKVDSDGFFNINGTLSDDDFHPLRSKRIDIVAGDKIVSTVTADDLGEYNTSMSASQFGSGKITFQAQFNSDSQLYKSASSEKIEVEIMSGFFWYLFGGVLVSVFLIGVVYYKYGFKKSEKIQPQPLAIQHDQPNPVPLLNPKECVIAYYNSVLKNLEAAGINKKREQTHWEFFQKVADIKSSISTSMKILTQLYEEAYYSKHVIEEKHSTQAKTVYKEIRENVENR